jgi:putative YphP/YqiW family bacilliredoxin
MPYPEQMVAPMRRELTQLGVEELRDADAVDTAFENTADDETTVAVINSVCGCAASNARPAVKAAKEADGPQPDRYVTVFAGQDLDATERLREKLVGIPDSSPFIALFKGQDPVYAIERRHIEGRSARAIASDLREAIDEHCGETNGTAEEGPSGPDEADAPQAESSNLPETFQSIK